jgi:hypothetical protein
MTTTITVVELLAEETLLDPYRSARENSPLGDGPPPPHPRGNEPNTKNPTDTQW